MRWYLALVDIWVELWSIFGATSVIIWVKFEDRIVPI